METRIEESLKVIDGKPIIERKEIKPLILWLPEETTVYKLDSDYTSPWKIEGGEVLAQFFAPRKKDPWKPRRFCETQEFKEGAKIVSEGQREDVPSSFFVETETLLEMLGQKSHERAQKRRQTEKEQT